MRSIAIGSLIVSSIALLHCAQVPEDSTQSSAAGITQMQGDGTTATTNPNPNDVPPPEVLNAVLFGEPPALAPMQQVNQRVEGEMPLPWEALTQAELDQVGTLDVVKCWALVSGTVATAGKLLQALEKLGRVWQYAAKAEQFTEKTLAAWIEAAGLTGPAAEGMSFLLIKAAEVAGVSTVAAMSKEAIKKVLKFAWSMANSCSAIFQTYVDGISKIPTVILGIDDPCNDKLDDYISCQKTCGASLSFADKAALYSFLPAECTANDAVKEAAILLLANGYQRGCFNLFCAPNAPANSTALTKFSQCTRSYTDEKARAASSDLSTYCKQFNAIK